LLDNAVACVQFPSPISRFEPVLESVMDYVRPVRHQGRLWMLVNGRMMRGSYDADGRLEGFAADTPSEDFVWSVAEIDGELFASNSSGIFARKETGWKLIAPGMTNARLGSIPPRRDGGDFYVARGEIGWIRRNAAGYAIERIPAPELGDTYNAVDDSSGSVWLEQGMNRIGRVEFSNGCPKTRIFGLEDGLLDGWPNVFVLDGTARFSVSGHLLRFRLWNSTVRRGPGADQADSGPGWLHWTADPRRVRPPLVCLEGQCPRGRSAPFWRRRGRRNHPA